jgi:hypothetical protein
MSENMEKFHPPLKEELPSAESLSPQSRGAVLYRGSFPWTHYPQDRGGSFGWTNYPQGTAIVVIGGDGHFPPPVPGTLPAAEDDTYRMERRDLSYLSYILSSWQRAAIALAIKKPSRSFPT